MAKCNYFYSYGLYGVASLLVLFFALARTVAATRNPMQVGIPAAGEVAGPVVILAAGEVADSLVFRDEAGRVVDD